MRLNNGFDFGKNYNYPANLKTSKSEGYSTYLYVIKKISYDINSKRTIGKSVFFG